MARRHGAQLVSYGRIAVVTHRQAMPTIGKKKLDVARKEMEIPLKNLPLLQWFDVINMFANSYALSATKVAAANSSSSSVFSVLPCNGGIVLVVVRPTSFIRQGLAGHLPLRQETYLAPPFAAFTS